MKGPPVAGSFSDTLINWTTAVALLAFGIIYANDDSIMWRTILALGGLMAASEIVKIGELRRGSTATRRRWRLAFAVAYTGLIVFGFLFPGWRP